MNGHAECIKMLVDAKADVNARGAAGKSPLALAQQHQQEDCVRLLSAYTSKFWESQLDGLSVDRREQSKATKLIVTAADLGNIDSLYALAAYARTGADVAFVLNYPAYLGVGAQESDPLFPERNPGLGYRYGAAEVLAAVSAAPPEAYAAFMERYPPGNANGRMRCALTDLAFALATRVWDDAPGPSQGGQGGGGAAKGSLYFCIGGTCSVNPCPLAAIQNEVLVYAGLVEGGADAAARLEPRQGAVYGAGGRVREPEWGEYADVYLDCNGPMAFWTEAWQERLARAAGDRVRGAFVAGGVRAELPEVATPPPAAPGGARNCLGDATRNLVCDCSSHHA
jgi:hypothetical protein